MNNKGLFSSRRREALKRLLEKDGVTTKEVDIPHWDGDRSRAPLSFAQERLWLIDQMQPGSFGYNMPFAFRMSGSFNIQALERSLNEVVRRHESLRTSFRVVDDQPVQVIDEQATFSMPCIDMQNLPEAERETAVLRLAIEEAQLPFDLTTGRLLRGKLLHLGVDEYILLLTAHHIVSDGWSIGVLSLEAITLYASFSQGQPSPLPELSIQYVDFAAWQRAWLRGKRLEKLQAYWQKYLDGMPVLELPTDHQRPESTSYRGATCSTSFSLALTDKLNAFCHDEGVSLFMMLFAGFLALLVRYTGQQDIVIRTPVANRTHRQTEALIGYLANILALRTDLSGNPTFQEVLRRVSAACLAAFAHQDLPFEQVMEDLHPVRRGRGPLFPVMFILQDSFLAAPDVPDGVFSSLVVDNGLALFDLTVTMGTTTTASGLKMSFNYSTDLFEPATIRTMMDDLQMILEAVLVEPGQRLDVLTANIPEEHIPTQRSPLLSEMEALGKKAERVAPHNEMERVLAEIWQDVLGIAQVGVHDNFFELGGDSLLILRIASRAKQAGLSLTPRQVFQHQTISELAVVEGAVEVRAEQGLIIGPLPLTVDQHWLLNRGLIDPHWANIITLYEMQQPMDLALLAQAFTHLLLHHDGLRARFARDDSGWRQFITAPDNVAPLQTVDFSDVTEADLPTALDQFSDQVQQTLNLADGPLVRLVLIKRGPGKPAYLLYTLHHLLADGVSCGVILEDFMTAYGQLAQQQSVQLPPKTTSLRAWAERLHAYARSDALRQEVDYWLGLPWARVAPLPVDYPDGREHDVVGSYQLVRAALSVDETRFLLDEIPRRFGIPSSDAVIMALIHAITNWSGGQWLSAKMIDSGRDAIPDAFDVDLSRTVGWLSFTRLLLLKREDANDPLQALRLFSEQLRQAPNRGLGYELLLRCSGDQEIAERLASIPQPEVWINYVGGQAGERNAEGPWRVAELSKRLNKRWQNPMNPRVGLLFCVGMVEMDQLVMEWECSQNVYKLATVEKVIHNSLETLRALIAYCQSI